MAFLATSPGRIYRYRGRPAPCGPLAVSATGGSLSPLLSWPRAEGCYDGYYLQLGSSAGGADLLPRTDVGLDTFYQVAATLPEGTEVFATVLPYNHVYGAAEGCPGSSFTTPVCGGPVAVDTAYCAGGALLWGDSLIAAPGTYTFSGLAANGCDTDTVLQVAERPPLVGTLDTAYCVGGALAWEGSLISEPGTYEFHYSTASGCDSLLLLEVAELPFAQGTLDTAYCTGSALEWQGEQISEPGTYEFHYTTASGCDSLLLLQVAELPPVQVTLDTAYCAGEAFYWEGELLLFPGTYVYVYPLPSGCDSTLLLNLERLPNSYSRIDTVLAPGGLYDGQPYSGDTLLSFVLPAVNGCDSLVEVYLSMVTGSREVAVGPALTAVVHPNPSSGTFELRVNTATGQTGRIVVVDGTGRALYEREAALPKGQSSFTIEAAERWPKGLYFLQLYADGEPVYTEKLIKQ